MKKALTFIVATGLAVAVTALVVANRANSRREAALAEQQAAWQAEKAALEAALEDAKARPRNVALPMPAPATPAGPAKLSPAEIIAARATVDATMVSEEIIGYVVALVRRTRELPSVALGASPRGAVHLLAAAKASARLAGRDFVTPDDVVAVAPAVLRHRLQLRPEAELERYTPDDAVATAISTVPVPR